MVCLFDCQTFEINLHSQSCTSSCQIASKLIEDGNVHVLRLNFFRSWEYAHLDMHGACGFSHDWYYVNIAWMGALRIYNNRLSY
jgi:hypothetical protein